MVGEDDAAVGGNGLAQPLHPFSEKEHHRGVVVFAAAILAAIEEIADRIEADDVGRCVREMFPDRRNREGDTFLIKKEAELWRRDQIAASRKRGMWMGGFVPMGYDVKDRKLVVNEAEATTVRMIFDRFAALGSASILARALQAEDVRNKRGKRIDKGFIYKLIGSRVYLGEAVHKGMSYPGEHDAIISQDLWDRVHSILKQSPRDRRAKNRNSSEALLKGLIFTDTGTAMTPTYTRKGERLYHYYTSMDLIRNRETNGAGPMRLAAAMVDGAVIAEMRRIIGAPEIAARVIEAQRREGGDTDERTIVAGLQRFNDLWDALYPAEQARIVRLLVDRVTVGPAGMAVDLRNNGITTLVRDLSANTHMEAAE
jgi:hypothetical protein